MIYDFCLLVIDSSVTTPALIEVLHFKLVLSFGPPPDTRDRLSLKEVGGEMEAPEYW